MTLYNQSQQEEFEADVQAILLPAYNSIQKKFIVEAALLWFGCLDLYETVCDTMCPKNPWSYKTHPTARQRFDNLLTRIPTPSGFNLGQWKQLMKLTDNNKQILSDDISANIEAYEFYGSVYLDKPNTEWRGKELIDREDYY
jgi:hypothetical protein